MAEHRLFPSILPDEERTAATSDEFEDGGVCGAEMSDGTTCERPTGECQYHE